MLMYDVDQRDAERKKARREKDEMSQEMKELKKLKETEQLYQREERKLFLGGLSMDTVRKKRRTNCSSIQNQFCVYTYVTLNDKFVMFYLFNRSRRI